MGDSGHGGDAGDGLDRNLGHSPHEVQLEGVVIVVVGRPELDTVLHSLPLQLHSSCTPGTEQSGDGEKDIYLYICTYMCIYIYPDTDRHPRDLSI